MKYLIAMASVALLLGGCVTKNDEEYIRCIQGFNDAGSGYGAAISAPAGSVIGPGVVGAAAALVLCEEETPVESPDVLVVSAEGVESQPLEDLDPVLMPDTQTIAPTVFTPFIFDSRSLQFELDKAELLSSSYEVIDPVLDVLDQQPELRIEISGHTCWLGSEAHNNDLSRRRAQAVADYLVSAGISRDRLVVTHYGESQPIASNLTEEGRERNRRVEINEAF